MLGKVLSHYEIIDKLGAGGMGVVYRARDQRLDREVALKLLAPAILSDESARRRFRQEAMALSRLSHPNIATVHDFDSDQGIDFLVMEHVEGETLGARLRRGALPEPETREIGIQIAEALEEAHERGVVHRDLKPGNVVVTPKGRVKILDFGLAKLFRTGDAGDTVTASMAGAWSGTLPYMPPEQLEGKETGPEGDLYALGAMLYEMVSGRRPFTDPSPARLMSAILTQRPPAIAAPGGLAVSRALQELVDRLLEKEPVRRPRSARDAAAALRASAASGAAAPASSPPPLRGLVVLPLENLSGDPEQEFFADGMTEELISGLAQIQALRVVSRTSAMRYKKTQKTLQEIGRELNVDTVVEGSVRRHADRVRITAQLIEIATDRHLWAKSYERDLKDVLALQGEVAHAIAQGIKGKLTPEEEARLAHAHTVDPKAYESYLKGRHHWNKRTDESLLRSLEYFREAVEVDPTWATAHVGLADAYNVMGFYGTLPPGDTFPKAKTAAMAALRLDPDLAEAYSDLGYVQHYHEWDWEASERSFQKAVALNEKNAYIHLFYTNMLAAIGRVEDSIREVERAYELDPHSMIINTARGWVRLYARDLDGAVDCMRRIIELEPDFSTARAWVSAVHDARGEHDLALAEATRAAELTARGPWSLTGLGRAYAGLGRRSEAEAILAEMQELATRRYVSPYDLALVAESIGEADQALDMLERAHANRANMLVLLRVDPRWDRLRSHPRFEDLVRRMAFPPARAAAGAPAAPSREAPAPQGFKAR
ncbi:MAG TPA: protein kinase [Candidatus Eisenbacteria bacterium]|nr:protein kinase [Candidatus Eisenbacteria bacterium]